MDILLIAGLWLRQSIWDDVVAVLTERGHQPHAIALPGVDDGDTHATLGDQLSAVVAAVDRTERPLVVGHSAACTLAWMAADRRSHAIARVALVGGFPTTEGESYAEFFEIAEDGMAFPGWEPFEGPDGDDLDEDQRSAIADGAVPVPPKVARAPVHYRDDRRFEVPVTLVCPEFGPDDAKAWIESGDVPELAAASDLSYFDIDSGHWPMVSCPRAFGEALADLAEDQPRGPLDDLT